MERFVLRDPLAKMVSAKKIEGYIDQNGCFICDSHRKCSDGRYYQIRRCGKPLLLHRYIYESYFHQIPNGLVVMHKCDNVLCINPDHLIVGTHQDNVDDRVRKGRGSRYSKSTISDDMKNEILDKLKTTSVKDLVEMYRGIASQRTIYYIRSGRYHSLE